MQQRNCWSQGRKQHCSRPGKQHDQSLLNLRKKTLINFIPSLESAKVIRTSISCCKILEHLRLIHYVQFKSLYTMNKLNRLLYCPPQSTASIASRPLPLSRNITRVRVMKNSITSLRTAVASNSIPALAYKSKEASIAEIKLMGSGSVSRKNSNNTDSTATKRKRIRRSR